MENDFSNAKFVNFGLRPFSITVPRPFRAVEWLAYAVLGLGLHGASSGSPGGVNEPGS